MLKQWIGCPPDNFTRGRRGQEPQAVVIHAYPSLEAADALFANPKSSESCHYVVAPGGLIHQYVDEADTAYHAGLVVNPSWALYRRGINPNLMTIGVAAAVGPGENWSEEMYGATAELIREIAAYWGFPADAEHVVLHAEIRASRDCTGPGFDRAELLKRVASQPAPARPAPGSTPLTTNLEQSFVRLLGAANLREGAPNTRARILRTLPPGTDVAVTGFTDRGERIEGNAVWYETQENAFLWAGATDTPQPLAPAPRPAPAAPPAPLPEAGIECGILRIDTLFRGQGGAAIGSHEPAGDAVGAIQDCCRATATPACPASSPPPTDGSAARPQQHCKASRPITGFPLRAKSILRPCGLWQEHPRASPGFPRPTSVWFWACLIEACTRF